MKITTAALAALLSGALFVPVNAADLGGNCCADLEERVAELEATTARKGNSKVSLEVSGHINEAVLFLSPGNGYDGESIRIAPATQSQSRFRFKGSTKINSDWSAGFLMEIGVGSFDDTGAVSRTLGVRHSALYVKSKSVGTIWLGLTSTASDGTSEVDLSRSGVASTILGLSPYDGALFGVNGLSPWDGGRANVVKYMSPIIGGFTLSASMTDEDQYDVALRYAGEFSSIRVSGAVAYRNDNGPSWAPVPLTDTETILGSASIKELKSGLFLSGSYGDMKIDGMSGSLEGYGVRVGVEQTVQPGVIATVYGEWARVKMADVETDMYGMGVVLGLGGAFDVYGTYKRIQAGDILTDDADVGMIGARIKF